MLIRRSLPVQKETLFLFLWIAFYSSWLTSYMGYENSGPHHDKTPRCWQQGPSCLKSLFTYCGETAMELFSIHEGQSH